jgi:hypothetical protein
MYAFEVQDDSETKKAKGVKKTALQDLAMKDYEKAFLDKNNEYYSKMHVFRSKLHKIHAVMTKKDSLWKMVRQL